MRTTTVQFEPTAHRIKVKFRKLLSNKYIVEDPIRLQEEASSSPPHYTNGLYVYREIIPNITSYIITVPLIHLIAMLPENKTHMNGRNYIYFMQICCFQR